MFCHMALWDKGCNVMRSLHIENNKLLFRNLLKILKLQLFIFHLSGEHFVTVRAGYALHSAVFCLSHVDVSDVGAEVGLGGENPHTEMTSLVARVV